jgi:hypothetical protein
LRFNPARDTNWQIATDDGTDQNLVDLGVVPTTSTYIALMELSSAEFKVTLMNTSFVPLATDTSETNLPLAADDLWVIHGVAAKVAEVRSIKLWWGFGANRVNG